MVLLYGANGYTAQLIIEKALQEGLKPILAGRNGLIISGLSRKYGLPYRIFDLEDTKTVFQNISDVKVVLHCAGPFIFTAKPMIDACILAGIHYLDITGETEVFEMAENLGTQAAEKGIMLMPGTGFDVVPTDCMAAHLHEKMPDATHLTLAFAMRGGGLSHGTASTAAQKMGTGGLVRRNGKLEKVPTAWKSKVIDFGKRKLDATTIPWGDLITAFHSTKIPNIAVYLAMPPKLIRTMRLENYFQWLFRMDFMRRLIQKRIDARPAGPSEDKRNNGESYIWGEVENKKGERISKRFKCAEGYNLTAFMSVYILKRVLDGDFKAGFQTPTSCYGSDLIFKHSDTAWID